MAVPKGVKSKECLYLPAHYSLKKRFQTDDETPTRNLLPLEDIVEHVFPSKYSPTYHNVAVQFLDFVIKKKGKVYSEDIASFVSSNNISKATFYNRILPKLRAFGLIKMEREFTDIGKKSRKLKISLSRTFGNYLMKIADSWLAILDEI